MPGHAKGPPRQLLPPAEGKSDWSHVLIPRGAAVMDALESATSKGAMPAYSPDLAFPASGVRKASPNHYAQAWGIEAARAAWAFKASGRVSEPEFRAAKGVLLSAYFPREMGRGAAGVGLWASEQGCPDAHGGQHLNGTSFARLAAWISQDPELLAASEELLLTTVRALLCVALPDLTVWQAGMRAPGKPVSSAATAWLLIAMAAESRSEHWRLVARSDQFYLQTRVLEYLRAQGDPLLARTAALTPSDAAPCTLKFGMDVYASADGLGHLSVLEDAALPARSDVCDWVLATPHGGVDWSTDGSRGLPAHGRRLYRFPGLSERS